MSAGMPLPDNELPDSMRHQFSPYDSNGGTIVAIAGDDFAVIGSDTRLSQGYNIKTRVQNKLHKMTPRIVMGSAGCWADCVALTNLVKARTITYHQDNRQEISLDAFAQMLSIVMYNRRFFPYYTSNILAGIDKDGKGAVYSYDPIGHCERTNYRAAGSAGTLLQSVLDSQIGEKNPVLTNVTAKKVTRELAVGLVIDCFISAAERDIYTGDSVIIYTITKNGIEEKTTQLRKD